MGADIQSSVRRFVPNNPKLAKVVTKVLEQAFRVRELPLDLVKLTVQRAFELTRDMQQGDLESTVFEEKLMMFVQAIKPRYLAKLQQQRQQKRQGW